MLEYSRHATGILKRSSPTHARTWLQRSCVNISTATIQASDRVLLRYKDNDPQLTEPLCVNGSTSTHLGVFKHADIIGKNPRDTVTSHKGFPVRVLLPTLAEYVTMSPRIVTPVYPADANLITSLLDIHVQPPGVHNEPRMLEILEAGTGQGGLTLYLARAVHAANLTIDEIEPGVGTQPYLLDPSQPNSRAKTYRRAIVHTVDIQLKYSKHAESIVKGFRRGIYSKNVDFHVGDVSEWIDQQIRARGQAFEDDRAFLSHIILDMPNANRHIGKAASVLITNGSLLIFNPSISQIMTVVELVKQQSLPLILDTVLELGHDMTGGRQWDVRSVVPRAELKSMGRTKNTTSLNDGTESPIENVIDARDHEPVPNNRSNEENSPASQKNMYGLQMVCRPKVGGKVVGGGFLGVFKKMQNRV